MSATPAPELARPCPTCGAQPGEGCKVLADGTPTFNYFHAARSLT